MAEYLDEDDLLEVETTIENARLFVPGLTPVTQAIFFCKQSQDDLSLMQMEPDMLNLLTEGQKLVLRGEPDEPAILCTKSSSFQVREAETSNSLLVVPKLKLPEECRKCDPSCNEVEVVPVEIYCSFNKYYEVKQCAPKLSKLRHLLENSLFNGEEYEDEHVKKYTYDDLLNLVQASEDEIMSELSNLRVFVIDGFARILDIGYEFRAVSLICETAEAESHPWDKIPKNSIIDSISSLVPRDILEQCFTIYSFKTGEINEEGQELYCLKECEVCRLYAEVLLKPTLMFNLNEFSKAWNDSVSEGMKPDFSQIEDMAIVDVGADPPVISYFPRRELPDEIMNRFSALFKKRRKWTYEEIEPYIRDIAIGDTDAKTLLAKYTRSSTVDGKYVYCSKW